MVSLIVACTNQGIIGDRGHLPWPHISEDMAWFKSKTINNVVVMGRKTWDSLNHKPLKDRINIVVSTSPCRGVQTITDNINENIKKLKENYDKEIFIIGGAKLFNSTINLVDTIYLTRILHDFKGDVSINVNSYLSSTTLIDSNYLKTSSGLFLCFETYRKIN